MGIEDMKQIKLEEKETAIEPKVSDNDNSQPSKKPTVKNNWLEKFDFLKAKSTKRVLIGLGVALIIIVLGIILPSISIYKRSKDLYSKGLVLAAATQAQDMEGMKLALVETKGSLKKLQKSYKFIAWTKFIPFFGGYTRDGQHILSAGQRGTETAEILIDVVEPYTDILGFTNGEAEEEGNGEKTAEERIDFIVKTIPDLLPKMDILSEKVLAVKTELDQINPDRYPQTFRGSVIREKIRSGIDLVDTAYKYIKEAKPILAKTEYLLGMEGERTYLVLFQNDKELRPTGGFMTAYSIMKVKDAKFEPVISSDIYNLDTPYKPVLPAPDPIVAYIKGPYINNENIRLRDMNWSPDFKESMDVFMEEAEKVGIKDVDGVIGVDTQLLVNLLDVIGPIGVPGFGNFSTDITPDCDCPQVIYELESFADVEGPIIWDPLTGVIILRPPNSDNRKKIIGPLMNSILANAMGQPKEKLSGLFEAGFKSLIEKHVLFYLFDDEAQEAAEGFGIAGRIEETEGDYLHINDANLGGRKSNLYVTQEVNQEVEIGKDGSVIKNLVITYKNPKEHDGWLNSVLPNWVRIYVPKGSELIDISGLEDKVDPYEDLGKTVFAGFFELRPQGVTQVKITYKLPFKVDEDYRLLVQKQPGTDIPLYSIKVGKLVEELFLRTDKEFRFRI